MRRRHPNGKQSGSALQQQGKSRRHRQRGLGARHLLRLLVLLAAQQGLTIVDGKMFSRSVLQPAAVVGGFLLTPQAAQAQCPSFHKPTISVAVAGTGKLTVTWSALSQGQSDVDSWRLAHRKTGRGNWTGVTISDAAARSYTITGLDAGTTYQVRLTPLASGMCPPGPMSTVVTGTTAASGKVITLTSDQTNNQITEGDAGKKDVTITVILGEAAPSGGLIVTFAFDDSGTAKISNSSITSCTNPNPADADVCWPTDIILVTAGSSSATFKFGILGDTRNEDDETVKLRATASGWTTGTITLTIKDNDAAILKPPEDLTIVPGPDRLYLSWTAPTDANRTGWRRRHRQVTGTNTYGSWSSWTAVSGAATTNSTITGLTVNRRYQVALAATGASSTASTATTQTGLVQSGLSHTAAATSVINEGTTKTYGVKLQSRPTGDVTVTPSSDNADITISPTSLTFSTSTWNAYQNLTVTVAADEDTDEDNVIISYSASGGGYPAITDSISFGIIDTTPTLQLLTNPSAVSEGTPISLTVTSDKQRTGTLPVRLTLAARSSSTFTAADIQGDLGPRNFNAVFGDTARTTGTVSIPTSTDSATEGAEAYRITLSDGTGYAVGTDVTADGVLNDLVTAGVTVSTAALTVAEEGGTGTYTVVLDTEPTGNVTVTPSSGDTAAATVSPASLSFTTGNWETAQTVTVTGKSDTDPRNETVTISHAVTGANYASVTAPSVTVTVTDDDNPDAPVLTTATSTTSQQIDLTWTHAGTVAGDFVKGKTEFDHWQVHHRLKGAGSWTLYSNRSLSQGISRRTLAVSIANTYPDGAVVEVRVRARAGILPPSGFVVTSVVGGPWSNTREVTYKNDSLAALTITGNPLTVTQGSSTTYTVKLTKAYGGVLSVTSDATDKATVSPATLTFTTSTYNTAQTVTVTGVANGSADIDHAFRLTGASADAVPDAGTVSVTVGAAVVIKPPTGLTIVPGPDRLYLSWTKPTDANRTGWRVRYRRREGVNWGNWSSWTAITDPAATIYDLTGLGRGYAHEVALAATGASNAASTAATAQGTTTGRVTHKNSALLNVNEGGTASYEVKITSRPTGDVTITPSSTNTDLSFDPTSLTFTTANWDTYQTLTVRAASDEDTNEETARISYTASGGNYPSTISSRRSVRITDTTPTLQLSTDPAAVTEGTAISLTVTSDRTLIGPLPVSLTLAARDSSTFTAADIPGTLGPNTFNADFGSSPGRTTGTVSIPTSTDADATEGAEAYQITLSDAAGYAVGTDVTADGVLNDGTAATVSVPATLTVAEGVSGAKALVTITTPRAFGASTTFNVSYGSTSSTADTDARGRGNPSGSNNGDYDNNDVTSVTFSATEKTKAIEIPIRNDKLDEEDETFTVTIAAAAALPDGFSLGNATTVVTITDDDATPVLQSIEDVTLKQGQAVDITASASDADGDTVTYAWSRKSGEDSPAIPGGTALNAARLNFTPPGTGTYTMTVTASDGANEATEEVIITVSNANVVQVPERVPVDEDVSSGNAVVRITTAEAFGQAVTFNVTYGSTSVTSDNDATGAATPASGDYDNDAVTSVSFGASDTSKDVVIPVTDDDLDEEDETFTVTIAPAAALPSGFQLARATTVVTITDDDNTPVLQSIEDVTLKQGQAVDITAAATDADGDSVTYTWSRKTSETSPAIPGGTSLTAARLNFTPPGTGTYTMTVTASDGANEATEEVIITVTDANVVQVPERVEVAEGDGNAVVRITTTEAFGQAVTFTVSYGSTSVTSDTDATGAANPASGDYDNDAVTSVTFNSTETTKNIEIPISDDQAVEGEETFTVTIASSGLPSGFQLARATTVVTITDNDTPGGGGGSTPSSVPAAPTGVGGSAASTGNGQVTLTWANPGDPTIRKWQVQRREIGGPTGARLGLEAASYRPGGQQAQPAQEGGSYGPWMDIPNSTASTTSHTVTGLTNGKTYGFRIRAVNTAGRPGRPSAEIRVTLRQAPARPTGVTATPGNGQVTLAWTGPTDATISKWQYQQKQGDGSYGPWMDVPNSTASTTSHTVTGLTNGVTYSFRIRAVNAGGNGAPSDEITATPIDQDVVQADKARSQALAATSRTLLGMATDVLGSRSGGEAPVALAGSGSSLGEQAMGVVENLLGIGGSELPTALTLEDVEDRLWSQSFQLTPPAKGSDGQQEWNPPSPQQRSWALWGAGELRSYRGNDDTEHLSYSGNMKTAWLGIDHQFTDRWMAGAALSFATGQSDYSYQKTDGSKDGGKMETRLTVVYPYGSFQVSEGLRLWGMAGMGWGSQHHRQTGDHTKTEGDLRLQMGVVGFEQALSPIGELSLSLAGDAGLVKSTTDWKAGSGLDDLSVSLHRIRLGIDSSFPLAEHTTAYLNLKGRLDGGDLEMNAAEIVAGLHYSKERFSGFLQGRQTYAFDGSYAESALTAQLRFTSRPDGSGLAWTLQPSYGASDGDMALAAGPSLWTDEQLEALTGSGSAQENREIALSSRVGYGIHLQSGELLLTPFTEMRFREAGSQHIGLGLALQTSSWNVELSSSTENTANSSPTTKTELNFSKKL